MILPRFPARLRMFPGFALSGLVLLGACAETASTRYPSLLPRAIERRGDAEPVAPVAVVEPDPALDAKIVETNGALAVVHKDFQAAATRADTLARLAKGAAVGSDRWLDAQTALAELDIARATSSGLVTDLEALSLARAAEGKPPYPTLEAARDAAQGELDTETARIAALQAALPAA